MRQIVLIVLALLVPVLCLAQTQALPTQSLAWDYLDADVEAFSVSRFETAYDGGAYVDVGLVAFAPDAYTTPFPALITGLHTVVVRACNTSGCGPDSAPFAFEMRVGIPPTVDGTTIRIVPTP